MLRRHRRAVVSSVDLPRAGNILLRLLRLAGIISLGVAILRMCGGVSRSIAVWVSVAILLWIAFVPAWALFLHDGPIVAVSVIIVTVHRRLWLIHRGHSVEGAVLATRIGAARPRAGAIRAIGYARVDGIVGLMVVMLRVWTLLTVHLGIGLHAVSVPRSIRRAAVAGVAILIAIVSTSSVIVAIWTGAVVVACFRAVGG